MSPKAEFSKDRLVRVFSAENEVEARIVQQLLRDAGIDSLINAEVASGLYPGMRGPLARHDIMVLESDADAAGRFISDYEASALDE